MTELELSHIKFVECFNKLTEKLGTTSLQVNHVNILIKKMFKSGLNDNPEDHQKILAEVQDFDEVIKNGKNLIAMAEEQTNVEEILGSTAVARTFPKILQHLKDVIAEYQKNEEEYLVYKNGLNYTVFVDNMLVFKK